MEKKAEDKLLELHTDVIEFETLFNKSFNEYKNKIKNQPNEQIHKFVVEHIQYQINTGCKIPTNEEIYIAIIIKYPDINGQIAYDVSNTIKNIFNGPAWDMLITNIHLYVYQIVGDDIEIIKSRINSNIQKNKINLIVNSKINTSEDIKTFFNHADNILDIIPIIGRNRIEGAFLLNQYAKNISFEYNLPIPILNNKINRKLIQKREIRSIQVYIQKIDEDIKNNKQSNYDTQINDTALEKYILARNNLLGQQKTQFGGGFVATSQRVLLNGRQNRIVYKKNGKGAKYVKIQSEFVKLKQSML